MKNVFDPHNNFDEWFENDWESDEYIESQRSEKKQPEGPNDWKILLVVYLIIIIVTVSSCVAC